MESTYTRLDAHDRQVIEEMINEGMALRAIADVVGKDPTSISREVKRNRIERGAVSKSKFMRNPCAHARACKVTGLCKARGCRKHCSGCERVFCHDRCKAFAPWACKRLARWPFVCNRCPMYATCPQARFVYDAFRAHRIAGSRASLCRRGIRIGAAELERVDALASPLLKRGQSPYHIWNNHRDELDMGLASFYSLINAGVLSAGRMHLARAVRFRRRRRQRDVRDRRDFSTRTYDDYVAVMGVDADGRA